MYTAEEIGFEYQSLRIMSCDCTHGCGKVVKRLGPLVFVCAKEAEFIIIMRDEDGDWIERHGCRKHAVKHWGDLWMQTPLAN